MEIKKIGVLSLAKIAAVFGILYGLIGGILISFMSNVNIAGVTEQLGAVANLGYWVILIFPIVDGITYFILAAIIALLYNAFAKWFGGIKLTLSGETMEKPKKK